MKDVGHVFHVDGFTELLSAIISHRIATSTHSCGGDLVELFAIFTALAVGKAGEFALRAPTHHSAVRGMTGLNLGNVYVLACALDDVS